jgi:hypothetical protein
MTNRTAVKADYPRLDNFFGAYLNQDYQLSGETIEEVVDTYTQDTSAEYRKELSDEIARFCRAHSHDLDAALSASYGFHFDPALWDHSAASFFELVQRLLQREADG